MLAIVQRAAVAFLTTGRSIVAGASTLVAMGLVADVAASQEGSPCAGEPVTCNEDRTLCCNWWVADVIVDGTKRGEVLEDSYDKLMKSSAAHRKMDASLCAFWHDRSDCATVVGPPHCSGAIAGAVKQVAAEAAVPFSQSFAAGESKLAELAGASAAFKAFTTFDPAGGDDSRGGEKAHGGLLSRIRSAVLGSHEVLDEYTRNIGAALARAKGLRTQLTECARTHNPFLDLDRPSDSGGLPRVWQTTINLGYGFAPTFQFSSPTDQRAQLVAGEEGRRLLAGLLARAPAIPTIVTLHLDAATPVSAQRTSGAGRLLVGGKGFLHPKAVLPAGDYPLLFASASGEGIAFSAATVSRAPHGGGERVTIRGSAGADQETVELFVCSGGREVRRDRCVCPNGEQWTGASCECPQGQHLEGGKCVLCPATTTWNGQSCACPGDTHFIAGACRQCAPGTTFDGRSCSCPTGQHFTNGRCEVCLGNSSWNGAQCVCAAGTVWNGFELCLAPR